VGAALEMIELIEQFNLERSAVQKPAIRIGIGVATGEVVAGYTGTQQRATYTCIGRTWPRAQARTKVLTTILIDRPLATVSDWAALGPVRSGARPPVRVFAVATPSS
jgi:class 3 adenylate cyclase